MSARRHRPGPRLPARTRPNALLAAGAENVTYRDVDLLRTFVSDRGTIRARRLTCLTPRQQREVSRAVKTAREMALLPYVSRLR
ncbi:30S ribosomal protein S18 [Nocardioides sp. IC4_145]|uniref:30S ribosomal protein S18 n=1 Tax=Nocardioides sp. IC4_145 TaxID=2714037 RepID=UPI00140D9A59|nr:30S ribosomal protein S18 [Nocardioides sp. IC4_145]NHC23463.1 30S ribosomal protein S18 [Nocardioides sp. IC4_145]